MGTTCEDIKVTETCSLTLLPETRGGEASVSQHTPSGGALAPSLPLPALVVPGIPWLVLALLQPLPPSSRRLHPVCLHGHFICESC